MKELAMMAASALIGALIVAMLLRRGYSVRPTKLSLPFLDVDLSRFDALSPVKLFVNISAAAIPAKPEGLAQATQAASATPVLLVHAGWNIVCEAFVRRFGCYPDDERIEAAAPAIGGQNVEFVKMYRDIHARAVRHAGNVPRTLAADYLVRAPSLAERIEGRTQPMQGPAAALFAAAAEMRHSQ